MTANNKALISKLLKGIETGDPQAASVVNEAVYIQHNPQTEEGSEGLAALFQRLSQTSPRVNIVRIFADQAFVFAHTEYDFSRRNVGFEVFRFDGDQAVEHWDNIQKREGPNLSDHSMVDGTTEICDLDQTEANRSLIHSFIENILIAGCPEQLHQYIDTDTYTEHSPELGDDLTALKKNLTASEAETATLNYQYCHRLLAEGNFVLSVCEGYKSEKHSAFYDLFRLSNGKIVEHWDTTEAIADRQQWKNNNGKF